MKAELYHGDCLEIMADLGQVDALITDPPYGVERDKGFGGGPFGGGTGSRIEYRKYEGSWDSDRPGKEYFDLMLKITKIQLIFGGNFFADLLPVSGHWIVWDKQVAMPTFGDAELIWTNSDRKSIKIFTVKWSGLVGKEVVRYHPTQKPEAIMEHLILGYTEPGDG